MKFLNFFRAPEPEQVARDEIQRLRRDAVWARVSLQTQIARVSAIDRAIVDLERLLANENSTGAK